MILVLPVLLAAAQLAPLFPHQRYAAAAGSRVGFRGDSTLHGFEGTASRLTADLHADLARLAVSAGGIVSFRVADLATGDEDRDENMYGDLDAERFPVIEFRLDRLEGDLPSVGAAECSASGRFTIHGVERARSFPARIERRPGGMLAVQGSLRFLQTEHGIEPHSTFGLVKVHDEVEVWFDLLLEPQPALLRDGTHQAVVATARTRVSGAETTETLPAWGLWLADGYAVLDAGEVWWHAEASEAARFDPRSGFRLGAAPDAESAFAEARERLASLQAKLAGLGAEQRARAGAKLEETIARLKATLEAAPAPGPAALRRDGATIEILLGDRVWARLEELAGDAPLPAALSAIPHLPAAVRAALRELRGVPARAVLLTANAAGTREITLAFRAPAAAQVPAWALDAAAWPTPPKE